MTQVRRVGDNIWRPSVALRLAWLLTGTALLAGTSWLLYGGGLSLRDEVTFGLADIASATLLPVVFFRWRMVLDRDVLYMVFLRVRRLEVSEILDAKAVPRDGLTFLLRDGRAESFSALGNTSWGHRRKTATRADLAARAVLCAAAAARGEIPPTTYRLPPMRGLKKMILEGAIWAAILELFSGL